MTSHLMSFFNYFVITDIAFGPYRLIASCWATGTLQFKYDVYNFGVCVQEADGKTAICSQGSQLQHGRDIRLV